VGDHQRGQTGHFFCARSGRLSSFFNNRGPTWAQPREAGATPHVAPGRLERHHDTDGLNVSKLAESPGRRAGNTTDPLQGTWMPVSCQPFLSKSCTAPAQRLVTIDDLTGLVLSSQFWIEHSFLGACRRQSRTCASNGSGVQVFNTRRHATCYFSPGSAGQPRVHPLQHRNRKEGSRNTDTRKAAREESPLTAAAPVPSRAGVPGILVVDTMRRCSTCCTPCSGQRGSPCAWLPAAPRPWSPDGQGGNPRDKGHCSNEVGLWAGHSSFLREERGLFSG
jgi:hypothetical protein